MTISKCPLDKIKNDCTLGQPFLPGPRLLSSWLMKLVTSLQMRNPNAEMSHSYAGTKPLNFILP